MYISPIDRSVISDMSFLVSKQCYKGLERNFYEVTPTGPLELGANQSAKSSSKTNLPLNSHLERLRWNSLTLNSSQKPTFSKVRIQPLRTMN